MCLSGHSHACGLAFFKSAKACADAYLHPCSFSIGIPAKRPTLFLQAKKVSKKARSPNYVLHPIIYEI
jgi:hypothetical protein